MSLSSHLLKLSKFALGKPTSKLVRNQEIRLMKQDKLRSNQQHLQNYQHTSQICLNSRAKAAKLFAEIFTTSATMSNLIFTTWEIAIFLQKSKNTWGWQNNYNFGPRLLRGISLEKFRTLINKLQDLRCGQVLADTEERTGGNTLLLLVGFYQCSRYDDDTHTHTLTHTHTHTRYILMF